ncbi:MAG: hypothetical protein QXS44_05890 [Saccharolobus sp.]
MDKYTLALLGEAAAAGLDRGFSIRYSIFKEYYNNEKQHWEYFRKYKKSILEKPIHYIFMNYRFYNIIIRNRSNKDG